LSGIAYGQDSFFDRSDCQRKRSRWKPSHCEPKKDHERSLSPPKQRFKGLKVTPQSRGMRAGRYRHRRQVNCELKHKRTASTSYLRLVGQLDAYNKWDMPVIIWLQLE